MWSQVLVSASVHAGVDFREDRGDVPSAVKNWQRTFNLTNPNNVSQMQQSLQQQLVSTVMACVFI